MKIFKVKVKTHNNTITLAPHYQCDCGTTFTADDLTYTVDHSGTSVEYSRKYGRNLKHKLPMNFEVKPDITKSDCPYCGKSLDWDNAEICHSTVPLAQNKAINPEGIPVPASIRQFPTTLNQNCLSHGCTTKPQISHRVMDAWVEHCGGLPCPVPTELDIARLSDIIRG